MSWKTAAMPAKPTDPKNAASAHAPREGSEPRLDGGPSAEGDLFGLWLQRQLHRSYAAIAAEPIPEALLRLIEEAGNRNRCECAVPRGHHARADRPCRV